jgi:H+/Cl- antiporter ClcA
MNRVRKLSRQISVVVLALISVTALLLATGLLVYVDGNGGLPIDVVRNEDVPLADPNGDEVPGSSGRQGINWEDSTTAVVAGMITVAIFVFVWFLVFRPQSEREDISKEEAEKAEESPMDPPVCL